MITVPDVKRGDTWITTFAWTQPDATPVDLSGCAARLMVRDKKSKTCVLSVSSATGELVINAPLGIVALRVEAIDMQDIPPSTYVTDLEVTFPDGTVTSTETIVFRVTGDVTYD